MRFLNRLTCSPPDSGRESLGGGSLDSGGESLGDGSPGSGGESKGRKLRDRWPFLNEPSAPVELKALVTQRITRYHEYSNLYLQLRDCKDATELSTVCGKLLDAYFDGRQIADELDYYQQHRRVLGRHPYFRHFQQLSLLRSCSVKDLLRLQQKTRDNIWRVNSEIKKGDKPHLDQKRRQKLQQYELKLQEINRLLGE